MKNWRLTVIPVIIGIFVCITLLSCQQPDSSSSGGGESKGSLNVTVRVNGLKDQTGQVIALLFRGPDGFPENGEAADRTKLIEDLPSGQPLTFQFVGLSKSTYAITVLHDENGDEQMNRSMLGIPQEGYGMSMNPPLSAGAPSFEDASFTLNEDRTLTVQLFYLERRREEQDG